ncbi:MAG: nicotinate-nucleotide adenylyltransferase [Candidatus Omnitrophica bacterium]|nr:nicotinate-nucleotide adenylyltransferase [Candidatus Omnitrophota bacterium]
MGKFANKRIGILGGTFNPVHNGHIHIARETLKKLRLDKIIFIPTAIPPHKKIRGNATNTDRLRMLDLATANKKRFVVSQYELRQKGKSYSIKTAKSLKKKYGKKTELFFLIGSDSLAGLKKWKKIAKLTALLRFVVVPRPGFKTETRFSSVLRLDIPKKDISSTEIRLLVRKGKCLAHLVPKSVRKYIKTKKLYVK